MKYFDRISISFFIAVLGLTFSHCSETSVLGSEFFSENRFNVAVIDTITAKSWTVLSDSIATSGGPRLLVGAYTDEKLGVITATPYFQIFPQSTNSDSVFVSTSAQYLNAFLELRYDGYSINDTTAETSLNVLRLEEEIEVRDDGYLYNTSRFETESDPVGGLTFKPRPHGGKLKVPLSDDFGLALFNLSQSENSLLLDHRKFERFLHGFALKIRASDSGVALGFKPQVELRIYYKDKTIEGRKELYLSYRVSGEVTNGVYFNQIDADRSLTKLSILDRTNDPLPSDVTDRQAYVQGGTGLSTVLEFPYLKEITTNDPDLIITEAILIIDPPRDAQRTAEDTLMLVGVDRKLLATYDFGEPLVLYEDLYQGRDRFYYATITDYVQRQLADKGNGRTRILVSLNENKLRFSLESARFDARVKLLVKYVSVNQ